MHRGGPISFSPTSSQGTVSLRAPLRSPVRLSLRKRYGMRRKSRKIPRYWQRVDNCAPTLPSNHALRLWTLVLESRSIPFVQLSVGTRQQIYVPPLLAECAKHELVGFHAENHGKRPVLVEQHHAGGNWAVLFFMLLLLWHGTVAAWWPVPSFLPQSLHAFFTRLTLEGQALGALDSFKMWLDGQMFRAVTALTLHASSQHVLGNVAFGSLFTTLLCRRMGLGCGLLLVVLGGTVGNLCNSALRMYQSGAFVSIGFSTALFAAVGALAGCLVLARAKEERRKAFVPLAAGGAILAMLGAEGENLDYMAHVFGLLCGFGLGLISQYWYARYRPGLLGQFLCGVAALGLLILAWRWAV